MLGERGEKEAPVETVVGAYTGYLVIKQEGGKREGTRK